MSVTTLKTQYSDNGQEVEIYCPQERIQSDGGYMIAFLAFAGRDENDDEVFIPYVAANDRNPETKRQIRQALSGIGITASTAGHSYSAATASDAIKAGSKAIRAAALRGAVGGFAIGVAVQIGLHLAREIYFQSRGPRYYLSPIGSDLDGPVRV